MQKAETKEHYVVNIRIFLDELLKLNPDDFMRTSLIKVANDVIESNKLTQMKYLLAEDEKMLLECGSFATYRKIMQRIIDEGYVYNNVLETMEATVSEVLERNSIKNKKQFKEALFFVEMNYENPEQSGKVNAVNQLLADFEECSKKKRR